MNLHVNEFIMPTVLQIYFKSTICRSILSKIRHLIMRFILLIKICLCIFFIISRVYLQSRIQSVGITIHTAYQRLYMYKIYTMLYKIYTMLYTTRVARTTAMMALYIMYMYLTKIEYTKIRSFPGCG